MKYTEELSWIMDKLGTNGRPNYFAEEKYKENIEFVHSLGLKCDCVGWCKLDLSNQRTSEIFDQISTFCKENGWCARGYYTRKYVDVESEWYELVPSYFKDNTHCEWIKTITDNGESINTSIIRAFHELTPTPKLWGKNIYVPERFRNFCIENNINDLDFCWVKDKGKYEAEQYFHVYGKRLIPHVAGDFGFKKSDHNRVNETGGWLPEIANIFYELQYVNLQDCYLANDLPDSGIVYAYIPDTYSCSGRHTLLIYKDIAESLLQQKILPASALRPAPVVKELPGGYVLKKTEPLKRPTSQFMEKMLSEYDHIKKSNRPIRMVSEKDALKILRIAKKERKEDFQKALTKAKAQNLLDTAYSQMVPYYCVANGGFLSDEYEFLSYSEAVQENDEFQRNLDTEELLDTKPEGIVIAKCPDGDVILLCYNGDVIRFSHEAPEITEQWPSLAQFFVDTINE